MIFGKTVYHRRSKFIDEIPEIYRDEHEVKRDHTKNKIEMAEKRKATQKANFKIGIMNNTAKHETYKAGEMICHSIFGEGMILSAKQMGNDTLLEIAFEKYGTKKLMANYAKLKRPQ
jgi:DNA helicase-2/ATP-dependent DNA helicase PcrA